MCRSILHLHLTSFTLFSTCYCTVLHSAPLRAAAPSRDGAGRGRAALGLHVHRRRRLPALGPEPPEAKVSAARLTAVLCSLYTADTSSPSYSSGSSHNEGKVQSDNIASALSQLQVAIHSALSPKQQQELAQQLRANPLLLRDCQLTPDQVREQQHVDSI